MARLTDCPKITTSSESSFGTVRVSTARKENSNISQNSHPKLLADKIFPVFLVTVSKENPEETLLMFQDNKTTKTTQQADDIVMTS